MHALKIIGIALGSLIGLIVIALFAVWLFVNPNDYKGRIVQAVKNSTGRELALPGDIKLSVFPWVALELGPASLGNPPGFSADAFAAIQHAVVRVKLLPLLRKQLQIGRIEIDGLNLHLEKNAQGRGNWQGFASTGTATRSTSSDTTTVALPELAGVAIKDSRLSYQDMTVDRVNLQVGRVSPGIPVPVALKLDFIQGARAIELAGKLELTLSPAQRQYRISGLEFDGTATAKAGAASVPWKVATPDLSIDLAAQTLSAAAFTAQLAAAHLTGSMQGSRILDAPSVTGMFNLDPVAPRKLMDQLGLAPIATRDPKALGQLAASGEFAYGGNAVRATKLNVQLDDSNLRGSVAITNLDTKALSFDLALDRIDIDRYRSPEPTAPQPQQKPEQKPAELPSDALKVLQLKGIATIGSATMAGIRLSQVSVTVDADNGVIHIAPVKAVFYGGTYSGDLTLDERGATPAMQLNQSMNGIDVAPLLRDFAKTDRISGRGNVTTTLSAFGGTSEAMMKSLSGHVAANLAGGAVAGVDLGFEINRVMALIQNQALPGGSSTGRTSFDTFKASADLTDGVAMTKDLSVASQNLRITGQGSSNLVTGAVDYRLIATILKQAPGAHAASVQTLAEIPVTVTGTMTNPTVRPDLEGMAKARAQQEFDKHKQEIQQKLQDKLKGLFH